MSEAFFTARGKAAAMPHPKAKLIDTMNSEYNASTAYSKICIPAQRTLCSLASSTMHFE